MQKPNPNRDRDDQDSNFNEEFHSKSSRNNGFGHKKEKTPQNSHKSNSNSLRRVTECVCTWEITNQAVCLSIYFFDKTNQILLRVVKIVRDASNYCIVFLLTAKKMFYAEFSLREWKKQMLALASITSLLLFGTLVASSLAQNNGFGLKNRHHEHTVLVSPEHHVTPTLEALGIELSSTQPRREKIDPKFERTVYANKHISGLESDYFRFIEVNSSNNDTDAIFERPAHHLYSIAHKLSSKLSSSFYSFYIGTTMIRRYLSCSTIPIEKDPSRLELADPVGWTKLITVGRYRFRLPAVTQCVSLNFSSACLDLLSNTAIQPFLKKSPRLNSLFESINESLRMGIFTNRTISYMTERRQESWLMSRRVRIYDLEEHARAHDRFFVVYQNILFNPNFPIRYVRDGRNHITWFINNMPVQDFFHHLLRRNLLFENRCLHDRYPTNRVNLENQILSQTRGSYYEFSILGPLLTVSRVKEALKEDITRRLSIKVLRTCKQEMTTNLVQFEINLNELAYDALGIIVEKMSTRSVTIRRIGPVLKEMVTAFGSIFEMRMYCQKGYQESSTYNFNFQLEQQRVAQMELNFLALRVVHQPNMIRNLINPNLQQVNSRWFSHGNCRIWISVDINKILKNIPKILDHI